MLYTAETVKPARVRVWDNGRVDILEAPRVAEFSLEVLGQLDPWVAHVDEAGNLDLAGQAVYRPVGFRQDLTGRLTVICERSR